MSATASPEASSASAERAWWRRALLVAQEPRPVFAALRDDSREAGDARQEPITALVFLAGIALALASSRAGRLYDDVEFSGILVPVWAFVAGSFVALVNYWVGGGVLYLALRQLGSEGTFRRARHLLGLAAAPLAFSLVLVPVRLAVYGGDMFRSGGSDSGAGVVAFDVFEGLFALWALGLLLIGIRAVERWNWVRSGAALAGAAALAVIVDVLFALS